MKCLSCNKTLNDREATRKYVSTGEFLDLCDHCYEPIQEQVPTIERRTIKDTDSFDEEE